MATGQSQTRRWIAAAALLGATLGAAPATAELKVTLSRPVTGRYESVGITVTDPLGGLDVKPGPLVVTMADSRDHRQTFTLDATGKPGEWYGRFTPLQTGRYTGTVILDRETQKDIGLIPLVRVNRSSRPGFLKLRPGNTRSLAFTSGSAFFPVGVRLETDRVANTDWKELLARLRRNRLNYVAVSLPLLPVASDEEQRSLTRSIDTLLIEAEQHRAPLVQLHFAPAEPITDENLSEFQARIEEAVRRWSHSPAVAGWELPGAESTPTPLRARLAEAVRRADRYGHLVIGQEGENGPLPGVDLSLAASNWHQPANRRVLMEVSAQSAAPSALPGEDSWQMLVLGGVGLPLASYNPDRAGDAEVLTRLARQMEVLRSVPYHAAPLPYPSLIPVDTPGSFCRYGSVLLGWMAPEKGGPFELPSLPRGRYRVRFWNPATDSAVSEQVIWSNGAGARVDVPANLQAVFLKAEPVGSGSSASQPRRTVRSVAAHPAPKPKPVRIASAKAAAPQKAAARKAQPVRKPAVKKGVKRAAPVRGASARARTVKPNRGRKAAPNKRAAAKSQRTVRSRRTVKKAAAKKKPARAAKAKPSRTTTKKRAGRRR